MTLRWNPTLLNRAIAPGIADFVAGDIPDLGYLQPMASGWLATEVLFALYEKHFTGQSRQYAISMMHRAHACFATYQQARESTLAYLKLSSLHNPCTAQYYTAVSQWENCLFSRQMYVDAHTKLQNGQRPFPQDNQLPAFRVHAMAQAIHTWSLPTRRLHPTDQESVPLWLSNAGLHTRDYSINYRELARLIEETCVTADMMRDPQQYFAAA